MRKIITVIIIAMFSNASHAGETDLSKFCLGKYCLGEPLSKYRPLDTIAIEAYNSQLHRIDFLKSVPALSCKPYSFELVPGGENPFGKSYTTVIFTQVPGHLKEGTGSYYRVVGITARFPKIGNQELNSLVKKVFDRAGAVIETGPLGRTQWTNPNDKNQRVLMHTFSLNPDVTADMSVLVLEQDIDAFSPSSGYLKDIASQPGCKNPVPNI